jgi:hypothetical protein
LLYLKSVHPRLYTRFEPFSRVERSFSSAKTDSTTVFVRLTPDSFARSSGVTFAPVSEPPSCSSRVCSKEVYPQKVTVTQKSS